ncbi:phospholipase D family protein [Vibrio maritimus]|uniref:phospholipase D family protein n=1 Tax=Vibrio maritimus TaxID=990268 RepID=UPI001F40924B|nr:phospholipase D family protein [Vibrio maritimus]
MKQGILLRGRELTTALSNAFKDASEVTILTAYLSYPAVEFMFEHLPLGVQTRVVCRARPDDIASGSCDLHAIKVLHYSGVKCFLSRELHAKLYVIDSKQGFIGSANFTSNGLRLSGYGNLELSTKIGIDEPDLAMIESIVADSVPVTSDTIKYLEKFEREAKANPDKLLDAWWNDENVDSAYMHNQGLYVADLPWCNPLKVHDSEDEMYVHDADVFKLGEQDVATRACFLQSKVFSFLSQHIESTENKEAYFGQVTEWIHSALKDDLTPYRSEIKTYIVNLLAYIEVYAQDLMIVDRPNYSARVSLKRKNNEIL